MGYRSVALGQVDASTRPMLPVMYRVRFEVTEGENWLKVVIESKDHRALKTTFITENHIEILQPRLEAFRKRNVCVSASPVPLNRNLTETTDETSTWHYGSLLMIVGRMNVRG